MTLPEQTAHRNQELARARSGAAGAGPGTVTRLWDASGVVQPDVAGERSLAPDRDALGAGEDAAGAKDAVITLGEKLLLAATLSQWNRIEALATQVRAVARLASAHYESSGAAGLNLTGAELRLLPLLATHLSLPEIGAELFLSPHTVKSQAISIYRKLGASSRREAVACARKSGLMET